MYLRFVIASLDQDSERRQGVFQAACALRDSGNLDAYEQDALSVIRDWFNEHLEAPTRFSRTKLYSVASGKRGIAWFRDTAQAHLTKMYEMSRILDAHGVHVTVLRTERIGYVVYEDEFQVVAEPFADVTC